MAGHAAMSDPASRSPPQGDGTEGTVAEHGLERAVVVDLDDARRVEAARRLVPRRNGNATLTSLAALGAHLLGTSSVQVSLLTDVQHVASGCGVSREALRTTTALADSLCAVTASAGRAIAVPDTRADPRLRHLPAVTSGAAGCYLGVPLRDSRGVVVGALGAFDPQLREWHQRDVLAMEELASAVVAELELLAITAEHETVLARLDLAMDAAGVGSFDWDLLTGQLTWDDRLMRIFDYRPGEFDSTIEGFNRRLHPDDLDRVTAALRETIEHDVEYDEVYRVVLGDGSLRWVSARGRALHDESGAPVRVLGVATDITEQRLAEMESATAHTLLELVSEAGRDLTGSLEVGDAVRGLARRMVPGLADWSMVTLVSAHGRFEDVESWHRDPALRGLVRQLAQHRFEGREDRDGSLGTLATGVPFVLESGGREFARRTLRSSQAIEALEGVDLDSVVVLPLVSGSRVIGLITLARGVDRPPMNDVELAAAVEISVRASTALEHARSYDRIRDLSEQLQRSMLSRPVRPDGMQVAVRYTPAAETAQVGGDWYDAFVQPNGATVLVIGDVIGHDSAAAAAMGQLRSLTRGIAYATGAGPAEILGQVAKAMDGLEIDTIATALVARVVRDESTGSATLSWSNAGHPPALLLGPDGPPRLLESHDLLLGLVGDEPRTEQTIVIAPGSMLLLFTDGLVERRAESIADGLDQLLDVVEAARSLPLEELVGFVHDRMVPPEPEDDVALVAVRVDG
jgi:serine phosphatase RsbU (regulator of sigma subunit)/PAS domain-containing protein